MANDFAANFRAIVGPRIAAAIEVQGFLLAIDARTWGEAFGTCFAIAVRGGATHLPDRVFRELRDWIASGLIEADDHHQPGIRDAETRAAKAAAEVTDYFRRWEAATQAADDEAWEWGA